MIKNIVFDMGNVLIFFDPEHFLDVFVQDSDDKELLFKKVFHSLEWLKTDSGELTVPQAIALVQEKVPQRLHQAVEDLFLRWIEHSEPNQEMEKLVTELKEKGYHLYLLSNISSYFHEFKHRISVLQHMDGVFASADYHMMKPYPEIYETFLQTYRLNAEECFFVDDLPLNIAGAEKVGIKGAVFHGDVAYLRQELQEEKII